MAIDDRNHPPKFCQNRPATQFIVFNVVTRGNLLSWKRPHPRKSQQQWVESWCPSAVLWLFTASCLFARLFRFHRAPFQPPKAEKQHKRPPISSHGGLQARDLGYFGLMATMSEVLENLSGMRWNSSIGWLGFATSTKSKTPSWCGTTGVSHLQARPDIPSTIRVIWKKMVAIPFVLI